MRRLTVSKRVRSTSHRRPCARPAGTDSRVCSQTRAYVIRLAERETNLSFDIRSTSDGGVQLANVSSKESFSAVNTVLIHHNVHGVPCSGETSVRMPSQRAAWTVPGSAVGLRTEPPSWQRGNRPFWDRRRRPPLSRAASRAMVGGVYSRRGIKVESK